MTPEVSAAPLTEPIEDDNVTDPSKDPADPDSSLSSGLSDDLYAPFTEADDDWDWELMPPNVIDTASGPFDLARHETILQTAMEGRFSEAAQLAVVCEREDITAYGLNSVQALSWSETRARVAELSGDAGRAAQLRATVAHMADAEWFERNGDSTAPAWHRGPDPFTPPAEAEPTPPPQRRTWPYVAAIAALSITAACVWMNASDTEQRQERAAAYKGVSATDLNIDGVKTEARASWSKDGRSVVLSAVVDWREKPKLVRIDSGDQTAKKETSPLKPGQFPVPIRVELKVPVKDRYQAVQVTVAVGGPQWSEGSRAAHRTIEFRSDRTAIDTETGKRLKQRYSRLL